jgi:ABC-type lipoprotein release transport system permease subunit
MILFVTAWRNLWRNGRRTSITLAAVTFGTAIVILFDALMQGVVEGSLRNATNLVVGEAEVHAPGWLEDRSIYDSIGDPARIIAAARARGIAAAPRSFGYGLVAHGTKSAGALLEGVDPLLEREAFDLARHVAHGAFLPGTPTRGLVLGKKLARSLDVDVGSEVVVVVQASDGSLGNDLFTVTGVLQSVGDSMDRSAALVHRDDFESLFVSAGRIHEIAFNTRGGLPLEELERTLTAIAPGEEIRTWRELLPTLSDMMALVGSFLWIFDGIFFLAAGLGVLNTMLMATHERIREFGVLKALGASPWRIARDVTVEALVLALLATVAGSALGVAATSALGVHGIDTARFAGETTIAGVAFDPVWRPVLRPAAVATAIVWLWITTAAAALYPAALAGRLDPVEALHRA